MPIESLKCPACGGPMASRVNVKSGQRFWGCKAYPACNGTRDTDGLSREEQWQERNARMARRGWGDAEDGN